MKEGRIGEIRKDVNLETMVFILDAVMGRFLQAYAISYLDSGLNLNRMKRPEIERHVNEIVELIRKGIGK